MKQLVETLQDSLTVSQKQLAENRKEKEAEVLALDRATEENFVKSGQVNVENEQLKYISD